MRAATRDLAPGRPKKRGYSNDQQASIWPNDRSRRHRLNQQEEKMMGRRICKWFWLWLLPPLALFSAGTWAQLSIQVLSSRPDVITGGDALVQVNVPADPSPLSTYYVKLNNVDITSAFRVVDAPTNKTLQGLVTGMNLGVNALV